MHETETQREAKFSEKLTGMFLRGRCLTSGSISVAEIEVNR